MTVENGNKIKVEYTGSFENGDVFDSSEKHGKPLEFEVGAKQVVPGFDAAVVGMKEGEEKEFTLQPDQAYGQPNPQMVQKIPKDQLPKDKEVEVGMVLGVGLPNGAQIPARIAEIGDSDITLDLNHPLAGKVLKFKIKVVGISN